MKIRTPAVLIAVAFVAIATCNAQSQICTKDGCFLVNDQLYTIPATQPMPIPYQPPILLPSHAQPQPHPQAVQPPPQAAQTQPQAPIGQAAPSPPVPIGQTKPIEAWKTSGVNQQQISQRSQVSYGDGRAVRSSSPTADPFAATALPPDDFDKPYLAVIGSDSQCDQVRKQLDRSRLADEFVVGYWHPDDELVANVGYQRGCYVLAPRNPRTGRAQVLLKQTGFFDVETLMREAMGQYRRAERAEPVAAELPRSPPAPLPIAGGNRRKEKDYDDREAPTVDSIEAKCKSFLHDIERFVNGLPGGWITVLIVSYVFRKQLYRGFQKLKSGIERFGSDEPKPAVPASPETKKETAAI